MLRHLLDDLSTPWEGAHLTRPVSFSITGQMIGRLDLICAALDCSRSYIVRELLGPALADLEREMGEAGFKATGKRHVEEGEDA